MDQAHCTNVLAYKVLVIRITVAGEEEVLAKLVLPAPTPSPAPDGVLHCDCVEGVALSWVLVGLGQDSDVQDSSLQVEVVAGESNGGGGGGVDGGGVDDTGVGGGEDGGDVVAGGSGGGEGGGGHKVSP